MSKIWSKTSETFNGNLKYFKKCKKKFWVFTNFWLSGFFHKFLTIGIFSGFSENSGVGIFFESRDFLSPGSGFFLFRDKNPRDFCEIPGIYAKSPGFLSPGFGIFSGFFTFGVSRGFFIPGIGIFFVGWDIPTISQLCFRSYKSRFYRDYLKFIKIAS